MGSCLRCGKKIGLFGLTCGQCKWEIAFFKEADTAKKRPKDEEEDE